MITTSAKTIAHWQNKMAQQLLVFIVGYLIGFTNVRMHKHLSLADYTKYRVPLAFEIYQSNLDFKRLVLKYNGCPDPLLNSLTYFPRFDTIPYFSKIKILTLK